MENGANDIAVVGMAGRFPGAEDVFHYWDNLVAGKECICDLSEDELLAHGIASSDIESDNYIKKKGVLKDAAQFAASFFGYSPHEAKLMDPQQRVLLETSFAALENAGLLPEHYSGAIGTFVSTSFNTYLLHCLAARPELHDPQHHYQMAIANGNDFLATRVAYKLNLNGPAKTIQTACSSSLVAIHSACQSLLNFECDAALAGGCTITAPLVSGYMFKKDGIGSPDGHCRPFDQDAAGTVPGNGVGMVVLKRLEDALCDKDFIYAIVKSSAINNDGNKKISYTAPSIQGQEQVVRTAHALAGVPAESISYIEAHGTGTTLGDPIEIEALNRAFGSSSNVVSPFCAIGSVKANIGHLDAAAGVAGFIKTVWMLHQKKLPPQINFTKPNPRIPFANSAFYINTALADWPQSDHPRRAGVSAFGIGGTNAHIILEEYFGDPVATQDISNSWCILPISAESAEALAAYRVMLLDYMEKNPQFSLSDIAYTLLHRRKAFSQRDCIAVMRAGAHLIHSDAVAVQQLSDEQQEFAQRWLAGILPEADTNEAAKTVPLPGMPLPKEHYWISNAPLKAPSQPVVILPMPRDCTHNVEQAVSDIIKDFLEVEEVSASEKMSALGLDSLMAIDICLAIEQQLGLKVSTTDFHRYANIHELCHAIRERTATAGAVPTAALPALAVEINQGLLGAPILFCIHPAGGSVTVFDEMAAQLPSAYRVIGIRSIGWGEGEEIRERTIEEMAQHYLATMKQVQPQGPYHLCGSSIGGTIAFEIARKLRHEAAEIGIVALLDSPASFEEYPALETPKTHEEIQRYLRELSPELAQDIEGLMQRDPTTATTFFGLWLSHARSIRQHHATACDVPIIYFAATETSSFLPENLVFPWLGLAKGGVEVHTLHGNHLTIHRGKHAQHIAAILSKKLALYSTEASPVHVKKFAQG